MNSRQDSLVAPFHTDYVMLHVSSVWSYLAVVKVLFYLRQVLLNAYLSFNLILPSQIEPLLCFLRHIQPFQYLLTGIRLLIVHLYYLLHKLCIFSLLPLFLAQKRFVQHPPHLDHVPLGLMSRFYDELRILFLTLPHSAAAMLELQSNDLTLYLFCLG